MCDRSICQRSDRHQRLLLFWSPQRDSVEVFPFSHRVKDISLLIFAVFDVDVTCSPPAYRCGSLPVVLPSDVQRLDAGILRDKLIMSRSHSPDKLPVSVILQSQKIEFWRLSDVIFYIFSYSFVFCDGPQILLSTCAVRDGRVTERQHFETRRDYGQGRAQ